MFISTERNFPYMNIALELGALQQRHSSLSCPMLSRLAQSRVGQGRGISLQLWHCGSAACLTPLCFGSVGQCRQQGEAGGARDLEPGCRKPQHAQIPVPSVVMGQRETKLCDRGDNNVKARGGRSWPCRGFPQPTSQVLTLPCHPACQVSGSITI